MGYNAVASLRPAHREADSAITIIKLIYSEM